MKVLIRRRWPFRIKLTNLRPQAAFILHPSSPPGALFYGYLKLFRKVRSRRKDLRLCLKESNWKPHLKNAVLQPTVLIITDHEAVLDGFQCSHLILKLNTFWRVCAVRPVTSFRRIYRHKLRSCFLIKYAMCMFTLGRTDHFQLKMYICVCLKWNYVY